jgi:hypothetical protein
MIDREHEVSIKRQAELVGISRGSVYYQPRPVSAADLALMRRIDELHLEHPFMGARMLRDQLNRSGVAVGRKEICDLVATQFPSQAYLAIGIYAMKLKGIFCQINADHGNSTHGMASFKEIDTSLMASFVWRGAIPSIRVTIHRTYPDAMFRPTGGASAF